MLRHFKMEMLKRQQEELAQSSTGYVAPAAMPTTLNQLAPGVINVQPLQQQTKAHKAAAGKASRSRSRRASKPQMEKRRRARINECLDILKSYVLTDSSNLAHLGIDPAASENQDEETIARTILKSSGLIHRHRGRKNPNKLEKADILELTVDYVRRLHEQRNELLLSGGDNSIARQGRHHVINLKVVDENRAYNAGQELYVPAHLSEPLTLDLSPKSRVLQQHHAANDANDLLVQGPPYGAPLTPPPSSASSMRSGTNDDSTSITPQMILSRILDNYKLYEKSPYQQQQRC